MAAIQWRVSGRTRCSERCLRMCGEVFGLSIAERSVRSVGTRLPKFAKLSDCVVSNGNCSNQNTITVWISKMQMFFIRRLFERSLAGKIDAELADHQRERLRAFASLFSKKRSRIASASGDHRAFNQPIGFRCRIDPLTSRLAILATLRNPPQLRKQPSR